MEEKFIYLRKKHPRFYFRRFQILADNDNLRILFDFKTEPDIVFRPEVRLINFSQRMTEENRPLVENLAFHIGMMEIFSYWKATCSPQIVIEAGGLLAAQIKWWRDFFIRGMGQFYWTNKINFRAKKFLEIIAPPSSFPPSTDDLPEQKVLVPVGGGKDSVVALEFLKKADFLVKPLVIHTNKKIQPALAVCHLFGNEKPVEISRTIDHKLFELNKKGYLNGHTPIAAYISFASLLAAVLTGAGQVAVGFERSAEEGNVDYLGMAINHQYDKSWVFESLFSSYIKNFISGRLKFFSLLRPLYEIQIFKLFSRQQRYFKEFRSCNTGQKDGTWSWCRSCPKCLFVFVGLYAFLGEKTAVKIIGENLFKRRDLIPLAKQLIGICGAKPFECVGTYEEAKIAFYLSLLKTDKKKGLPPVLEYFRKNILRNEAGWETRSRKILMAWGQPHHLPMPLAKLLKSEITQADA